VNSVDEEGLREFLIKGGRSQSATKRCVVYVREFEWYLQEYRGGKGLDEANPEDLEAFVLWGKKELKTPKLKDIYGLFVTITSILRMKFCTA